MSPRSKDFYEAITPDPDKAKRYVEGASEFIAAVEHMLADGDDS